MKLTITQIIRFFVTIFIFISINLFGLHDFYSDRLFFVLNTLDFSILVVNVIFIFTILISENFRNIINKKPLKYLLYIYIIIIIVFFSMPLRGPISVIDAMRVGRHYLIIPLAFLIYYDVITKNKARYYFKMFNFIAIFSALQIIINAINPDIINLIFKDIGRAEEGYKGDFQRNIFLSKTMIFPHLLAIYYYYKLLIKKTKLKNLIIFLILMFGSSLQGFRVYLIILAFILLLMTFLFGNSIKKTIKWVLFFIFILYGVLTIDNYFLNNQIFGKFYTAYQEIKYLEGTYKNRLNDVKIRQIPMLLQKPYWGWGFIYYDSEYGKNLNIPKENSRQYGLYSVDSGYVTILMQFGFVGVIVILFLYFKLFLYLYREKNNLEINIGALGTIIILVLSLYTHGAFFREFGLIPFTIILGITGQKFVMKKNEKT